MHHLNLTRAFPFHNSTVFSRVIYMLAYCTESVRLRVGKEC